MRKGDKGMKVFGVFVILAIIVSVFGGVVSAEDLSGGLKQSVADAEMQTAFAEDKIQSLSSQTEIFVGQGFDKCEIPTLSQMQNWITNSPYGAVNLYIGGSCRSCLNSALTASYVSQLSQQGWKFIPTWVGPQSACWGGSCGSISNDPATAYNQGISEANAAIDVAIDLGLALADGSGTIIYYDLEGYDTTNTACRNAAKSFISGWTAQLHARGSEAGVYGSACSSAISDFASISNVPDAIWPAHWIYSSYNSGATVWDVACLSNSLWVNHQRIRQYAGGHGETWGGVTLNIDCNVIDGIVASVGDKFNIGDSVRVTTNLNVRIGPGTGYPEIADPDYPGYAPAGTIGTVLSGPSSADSFIWWEIDYGPGLYSGWSVEGGLEKVDDNILPTVDAFSVTPDSVTLGEAFTIPYTVSDTGGSGLKQVELWRKGTGDWEQIGDPISLVGEGDGPYSNSFYDAPTSVGTYEYGMHVVDNAGNLGLEPDPPGPIEVTVTATPSIDLSPSSYGFGDWQVGQCSSEYSFTLTNTGGGTATGSVSLTGTHATQFTITQGSGSFALGTGASKTIKVKFCPTSMGAKSATLFADGTNCNDDTSSLSGTGTQQPSIDLSPSSYGFGDRQVGQCSSEYSFTLTNTGGGTATGSVSLTGTHATQFTITQGSGSFALGTGASKTIKVKFCPTSTGAKSATLFADGTNCNDDTSSLSGTGVENAELSYSPTSHDFGDKCEGVTDSTTFEIWNSGTGTLTYTLSESCDWVDVNPASGSSTVEHDTITVDIDTTGLSEGTHTCDISISSNDGSGTFTVTVTVISCECDGTDTSCGIYPDCENCNEDDGCYVYDTGCEERDYYCTNNEEGCDYTYSNRHTDGWVDTGNTRWEDVNECQEKERKEQKYRDYYCSGGACTYGETGTQWVDTGNTRNKPDGTICGCTARNTLKRCYGGVCTDTGICDSTTCGADAACDGKEPGDSCGGGVCDSNCKCGGQVVGEDYGIFSAPLWFVDTNGDHLADDVFGYGFAGATPLVGDFNQDGSDDIAVVYLPWWFVDTNGDHIADETFGYGFAGGTPLVGDFDQDGKDDIAVVSLPIWFVDTDRNGEADLVFGYGFAGATPMVGDFNQDGSDDIAVVSLPWWFVDTDRDQVADDTFGYGFAGATPMVGDFNQDGSDDIAVVDLPWWFVDTDRDQVADDTFGYGFAGATPMVGDIG